MVLGVVVVVGMVVVVVVVVECACVCERERSISYRRLSLQRLQWKGNSHLFSPLLSSMERGVKRDLETPGEFSLVQ